MIQSHQHDKGNKTGVSSSPDFAPTRADFTLVSLMRLTALNRNVCVCCPKVSVDVCRAARAFLSTVWGRGSTRCFIVRRRDGSAAAVEPQMMTSGENQSSRGRFISVTCLTLKVTYYVHVWNAPHHPSPQYAIDPYDRITHLKKKKPTAYISSKLKPLEKVLWFSLKLN